MRRLLFLLICLGLLGSAQATHAQLDTSFMGAGPQIVANPEFPDPESPVALTINDAGTGVGGAIIDWRINGKVDATLNNRRNISLTTGKTGVPMKIEALLTLSDGTVRTIERTITPHYLDLVIEPQTRTPYFYQGRALPSFRSQINATAVLDGSGTPNTSHIYLWSVNGATLSGGAMRAQNQVSFEMPTGEAYLVVTVSDVTGEVISRKSVTLSEAFPTLRFHEVSPLYGVAARPVASALTVTGNSATLRAEPYHLDTRIYNRPDIIEWFVGGTPVTLSRNPYETTFLKPSIGVNASFHVRSSTIVLQGVRGDITVQ